MICSHRPMAAVGFCAILLFPASATSGATGPASAGAASPCAHSPAPQSFYPLFNPGIGAGPARASGPWSGPHAMLWVGHGSPHGLGQKIVWAVRRTFRQAITLQGWNVRTHKPMLFQFPSQPGATGQRVRRIGVWLPSYHFILPVGYPPTIAWHGYPSAWYVPSAGCYVVRVSWQGSGWSVPFRAVVDRMR